MDIGTTRWMAPELFGDPEFQNAGPSSLREFDLSFKYHFKFYVYSFGMVCYGNLTRDVPISNCKLMDLWRRTKDGLRPDIPDDVLIDYPH
jgi:serine/threonine protein kinase